LGIERSVQDGWCRRYVRKSLFEWQRQKERRYLLEEELVGCGDGDGDGDDAHK